MCLYTWHKRSTKEMLLHHVVVFTFFGIAAHTKVCVPYAVIALIVEVNSMFLHARTLLLLTGNIEFTLTSISFSRYINGVVLSFLDFI